MSDSGFVDLEGVLWCRLFDIDERTAWLYVVDARVRPYAGWLIEGACGDARTWGAWTWACLVDDWGRQACWDYAPMPLPKEFERQHNQFPREDEP